MVHVVEKKHSGNEKNGTAKEPLPPDVDVLQPTAPDGGWGWVVVFASFMVHVITDGVTYSCGLFQSEFVRYFHSSQQAAAWISSLLVGVTYCSGPFSSFLVNKYGCQAVTILGTILASLCLLASVWANSITILYFTVGIGTGLGFGLIYLPAIVSVTVYFEKYRSLATGIAVCGSGMGTVLFAEVITQLISYFGDFRYPMMALSAIVLICIVFGIMFVPLKPSNAPDSLPLEDVTKNGTSNHCNNNNNNNNNNVGGKKCWTDKRKPSIASSTDSKKFSSLKIPNSASSSIRLALSQPILNDKDNAAGRPASEEAFARSFSRGSGIMNRSDVFLRSSIHNIRKRSESLTNESEENAQRFRLSVRSLPNGTSHGPNKAIENADADDTPDGNIIKRMLKFSLLKDPVFIIFSVSNFCTSIGFNVPYVYLSPLAAYRGVDNANRLLAVIGIANAVGRIALGYVSDKPWINRLLVYNMCLTVCGIATALSPFCDSFVTFAIYASVYGFTAGAYVGLTSVCLVDLVGLDRLTNAFGLVLLCQGIASFLGPPLAGFLYDISELYDLGFYMAGSMIAISGFMLYVIPPIQKRIMSKDEKMQRIVALP